MTTISRCPRCESREVIPCDALLEASDETLRANYECAKCHTRFRYTPGTWSAGVLRIDPLDTSATFTPAAVAS